MSDRPTFWFAAKRYGYGWGLPVRWQGWVMLAAYFVLLFGGIYYFEPAANRLGFFLFLIVITAALVAVIAAKGERPLRWRWGKK
jgi:hypothetical protein